MKNHRRFAQASRNKREHQPMRRRQGFTLVELLVAMALIIFIMAILSQAFVSATGTFRSLKASGDMAEKLRATTQLLQRDLAADHFEGKKRLSDPNFWLTGPPEQGYFQIYQANTSALEGNDLDGIGSYRTTIGLADTPAHALAFSIKVRGNQMGDFLSAGGAGGILLGNLPNGPFGPNEARYLPPAGATSYNYQWGEVAWFLRPQINPATGQQDTTVNDPNIASAVAVPLYTLYRRQRVGVPDNSLVPAQPATSLAQFLEVSCWANGAQIYFSNPIDLTVPLRRFGAGNPTAFTTIAQELGTNSNLLAGSDIQLTDVVSFDVRILNTGLIGSPLMAPVPVTPPEFVTLFDRSFAGYTYTAPAGIPASAKVFDTWTSINDGLTLPPGIGYSQWNLLPAQQTPPNQGTTVPLWNSSIKVGPIIRAIQVSIRIWDSKTNQTRQVTMVQAM
jgi:prepilin-type N-terminal cleavage/methylation domain-containing protein